MTKNSKVTMTKSKKIYNKIKTVDL